MEESVRILTIKPARNGFLVYVNEEFSQGTVTRVPYVFESMASLQNFIRESLEEPDPRLQCKPSF